MTSAILNEPCAGTLQPSTITPLKAACAFCWRSAKRPRATRRANRPSAARAMWACANCLRPNTPTALGRSATMARPSGRRIFPCCPRAIPKRGRVCIPRPTTSTTTRLTTTHIATASCSHWRPIGSPADPNTCRQRGAGASLFCARKCPSRSRCGPNNTTPAWSRPGRVSLSPPR